MNNDTNRVAEFEAGEQQSQPQPSTIQLAQTGCSATLGTDGVIQIINPNGQQLYALKAEHIPFEMQPLLVTLNLWFMAFNNGRTSLQQELREKCLDLLKSCL